MLAANMNPKNAPQKQQDQVSVDQPQKTVAESRESPRTLKIPEALPDQDLRRETEEEFDVDAEFDDDEILEVGGDRGDGPEAEQRSPPQARIAEGGAGATEGLLVDGGSVALYPVALYGCHDVEKCSGL